MCMFEDEENRLIFLIALFAFGVLASLIIGSVVETIVTTRAAIEAGLEQTIDPTTKSVIWQTPSGRSAETPESSTAQHP